MRVIGTINKRIDVGYSKPDDMFYLMASSNCIKFNDDELGCVLSVLSTLEMLPLDEAIERLNKHNLKLWEPAPPPAEVRII